MSVHPAVASRAVDARRLIGSTLGGIAVFLIVLGTFLPWVRSGGASYSSYAIAGLAHRLQLTTSGVINAVLSGWPGVGPLALVPVITGLARWWTVSRVAAVLVGVIVGAVGAGVMTFAGGHELLGASLVPAGPVGLCCGAALLVVAGLVLAGRPPGR